MYKGITVDQADAVSGNSQEQGSDLEPAVSAHATGTLPEDIDEIGSPAEEDELPSHSVQSNRRRARTAQLKQAERMLRRSRSINVPATRGDNVTVAIPLVDRGRGDPRNLIAVVLDRDNNDMYKLAAKHGILQGKYSRNQFSLCSEKLYQIEDMNTTTEVALRAAVKMQSRSGGQGFVRCNCAGANRCESNRCKCFKSSVKCNSRCHQCLSCCNK